MVIFVSGDLFLFDHDGGWKPIGINQPLGFGMTPSNFAHLLVDPLLRQSESLPPKKLGILSFFTSENRDLPQNFQLVPESQGV